MAQGRPYNAYQKTSIQTSNQKQLIVMLYDGINKFLTKAANALDEGDLEAVHVNLHRSGKIILELTSTLREDRGGEVAKNLKKIYIYCYEQVVMANLRKDKALILEVQKIMNNLGDGWRNIQVSGTARGAIGQPQNGMGKVRITG